MSMNSPITPFVQQDVSMHPVGCSTPPPQTTDFPTRVMRSGSPIQDEFYSQPPSPSTPPPPPPPTPPPLSKSLRSSLNRIDYQRAEVELLKRASAEGRLQDVQQILSQYISSQHHSTTSRVRLEIFHESITEAIRYKQQAILSFLFSKNIGLPKHFIHTAIAFPSSAIFHAFLDSGWSINEPLERIKPPALGGDQVLTPWFLDHGADPNVRCDWDYTPMSIAVYQGSLSSIKMLFDRGGDINQGQLLHNAVQRRTPDVIDVVICLLDRGASINDIQYQNDDKSWGERRLFGLGTPLHYAAQLGNVELVKLLLSRGADPEIKNTKNRTVLQAAEYYRQSNVVEFLIRSLGADND